MGRAGRMIKQKNRYILLVGKLERKRPLVRSGHKQMNITMTF